MPRPTYADLMVHGTPFIEIQFKLERLPELSQLVGALASVGNQFDDFIRRDHPHLDGIAQLFVKEIRQGSIIVELIPQLTALIASMDTALIVDNFVTRYGGALRSLISGDRGADPVSKTDIADFTNAVEVVASDSGGQAIITSAVYHEKGTEKRVERRVEFQFTTQEARDAKRALEQRTIELETAVFEEKKNVLMVFWQPNLGDPKPGKRTGERAIIEAISPRPLAVVYETELARERIKHEAEQGERNIFKLGFFVDCYVERLRGKPVAYRITDVREIIPLPDDEDD